MCAEQVAEVAALRLHLCKQGFIPLPLYGKEPPVYGKNNKRKGLTEWTALRNVTRQQIEMWGKTWPDALNTGVLARDAPALDIDILNEPAARAVEELARKILFDPEEQDDVYVRFGLPPKRLIPLRTDQPFRKLYRLFRSARRQRTQNRVSR